MKCPNYLICNSNENNHNGVCYNCDGSRIGYYYKKRQLHLSLVPSVLPDPKDNSEYESRKLNEELKTNLISKLENNKLTTGILNIEEISENCHICLEDKHIFVKHPTCNIHNICDSCFKKSFFHEVDYPKSPECYNIFLSFLDEYELEYSSNKDNNYHDEGCYNHYCDKPKEDWPLNIKKIYSICNDYDRREEECMLEEDRREDVNSNIRQCPICRKCELHI